MKCGYYDTPRQMFPCSKCEYKNIDCEDSKHREPLTCHHCKFYCGINKTVCHKRKGYNIRPCEKFEWD